MWSVCSHSCRGCVQARGRSCTDPCPRPDVLERHTDDIFITFSFFVDGEWTSWSMWSVCSHSCRGGVQARGRSCTDPRPGPTGLDCPADDPFTMWQKCNEQPCPGVYDNNYETRGMGVTLLNP